MGKPSASASSSKHGTEKKKSKKRERVEEEEEVYVVEKILDKRVLEDGTVLYYLKWRVQYLFLFDFFLFKSHCCSSEWQVCFRFPY